MLVVTLEQNLEAVFIFIFFVQNKVSLCSLGCSGTHSVHQAGLDLIKIHQLLPQECWDERCGATPG